MFGAVGWVLVHLGLAAVDLVPDPLAGAGERWAPTRNVVTGVLTGAFLIGGPWALFRTMFQHAATGPSGCRATSVSAVPDDAVALGFAR